VTIRAFLCAPWLGTIRANYAPEILVFGMALLLNLVWEFLHAPLFVFKEQSSWSTLTACLLFCAGVDAMMMVFVYWFVALIRQDRSWFLRGRSVDGVLFALTALTLAFVSEYTAVYYRDLWRYSERMLLIPLVRIGTTPILQWLILPTVIVQLLLSFRIILPKQKDIGV
jgi:hypothetical protein